MLHVQTNYYGTQKATNYCDNEPSSVTVRMTPKRNLYGASFCGVIIPRKLKVQANADISKSALDIPLAITL